MVLSEPALTTGATLGTGAAFTVTFTLAFEVAPSLSVTFSSKTYTPATNPSTAVAAEEALTILYEEGPEIFVQA